MEKLKLKYENLSKALQRLEEVLFDFQNLQQENAKESDERKYRIYRDSMIQRFEICVDLFWKYLKMFLEEKLKQIVKLVSPKPVVKDACRAKLISEKDAEVILEMINARNQSSHVYKEEVADYISSKIGNYYKTMVLVLEKMSV